MAKFDFLPSCACSDAFSDILSELPKGWLVSFAKEAEAVGFVPEGAHFPRVCFQYGWKRYIDKKVFGEFRQHADLVVGYQVLHWFNAGESAIIDPRIIGAILRTLKYGGTFLAGTSTAFVQLDPNTQVEGMGLYEYSIDQHPFVQLVYAEIASRVCAVLGSVSQPTAPQFSMQQLIDLFLNSGFRSAKVGGFLVTPGREKLVSEVVRIRPVHQGRLNGINESARVEILDQAILAANQTCDIIVREDKGPDPRVVETNVWDVVPWIKAKS
jgi:hypothetical protein